MLEKNIKEEGLNKDISLEDENKIKIEYLRNEIVEAASLNMDRNKVWNRKKILRKKS